MNPQEIKQFLSDHLVIGPKPSDSLFDQAFVCGITSSEIAGIPTSVIDDFQDTCGKIEIKECYYNASRLTNFFHTTQNDLTPMRYVEGYVMSSLGFIIPHAWNSCGGNHFDITAQYAQDKCTIGNPYIAFLHLDSQQLRSSLIKYQTWGEFLPKYGKEMHMG